MTSKLFFNPGRSAIDLNGLVVPGAELFFYQTKSSLKAPIYSDAELTVELTNPVVANGAGRWPNIYLDDTIIYRARAESPSETLFDVDPYYPGAASEVSQNIAEAVVTSTTAAALAEAARDTAEEFANVAQIAGVDYPSEAAAVAAIADGAWASYAVGGVAHWGYRSGAVMVPSTYFMAAEKVSFDGGSVAGALSNIDGLAVRPLPSDFNTVAGVDYGTAIVEGKGAYHFDAAVPAGETGATNARTPGYLNPGRKKRYLGIGTGRFVSDEGLTQIKHYGISPWNSAGQNDAAWNVLRDEITDLQTRQENRPLVLQFDNDRYLMSSKWDVWNNHIRIEGRGAELVGGGIAFTNNGSVNQQLYCGLKDLVIRGEAGQSIPVLRTLVSSYLTVDNVTLWGTAGQHGAVLGPGNTSLFKQLKVYGAGLWGILMTAENAPHPSGGVFGRGQPIDMTFIDMDVQGNGGGVGIYEAQSVRFFGGAIQSGSGVYGRGLSIETGYDINVYGTHFERNGADIYIEPVDRLGTSLWGATLPHGSISLHGLGIGGEGVGGAPSPISLLVAGDTPDLMVAGGYYSGAVNINTTGTTGAIIGAKMPSYSAVAGSPVVRMGARGSAVPDAATATYVAPSGGATVDAENRAALAQLAADVASLRTSNNAHLARQRVFGAIAT